MTGGRGAGARIAIAVLLLALLVSGVAGAAAAGGPGSPDPSFGKGGRVAVSLLRTSSRSWFGRIAPAERGRFLVAYIGPFLLAEQSVIERRLPDGALDPSFGNGGSVTVSGLVMDLAEDPRGGVVYSSYGVFGRLGPRGERDKAFDARASRSLEGFGARTIAFDPSGRILAGGSYAPGARYHPHEGEAAVRRFEPDGTPDPGFGSKGVVYLPFAEGKGEFGLLPDGSILANGENVTHLAADGTVLPSPGFGGTEKWRRDLVVFAEGGFALVSSSERGTGCEITRYDPAGAPDPVFAQGGVFSDPDLSGCQITAAPEGGLLLRGTVPTTARKKGPELLLLTAAGVPATGFGSGGAVTVPEIADVGAGRYSRLRDVTFLSDGRLVATGDNRDGVLVGLGADGALDRGFGAGGTVVQRTKLPSSARPQGFAVEPDGELILAAETNSGSTGRRSVWLRFDPAGRLRRTSSGAPYTKVSTPPPTQLLPVGRSDLYGSVSGPDIARFNQRGGLVDRFGNHGLAALPKGFAMNSFVVGPNGGATVFGVAAHGHTAVYRMTAAGRPDYGFGDHGLSVLPSRGAGLLSGEAGAVRPDGGVVVAGPARKRLVVAELRPDGHLRRGFARGGLLRCSCGGTVSYGAAVALHRGAIYILDQAETSGGEAGILIKVDAAGRLDRSFAGHGYRRVAAGGVSVGLFARGARLLVVDQKGYVESSARVRAFDLDGAVDRSYRQAATLGNSANEWEAPLEAAQEPDGRLVLVGQRATKKEIEGTQIELLRLR